MKKKNPTFLSNTFFVPPPHFASHVNSQVLLQFFFFLNKIKLFFSPPLLRQFTTQKLPDLLSFIKLKKKPDTVSVYILLLLLLFFFSFILNKKKSPLPFNRLKFTIDFQRTIVNPFLSSNLLKVTKKRKLHTHTKRPILLCHSKQ